MFYYVVIRFVCRFELIIITNLCLHYKGLVLGYIYQYVLDLKGNKEAPYARHVCSKVPGAHARLMKGNLHSDLLLKDVMQINIIGKHKKTRKQGLHPRMSYW